MKSPSLSWPLAVLPDRLPGAAESPDIADRWDDRASTAAVRYGQRIGLFAILLLSATLNLYRLNTEGYANSYYAAAVKSMLTSWHNFFFVSYDPGGFVSVDKPPLGFWIQAASARLFGFSGLSLLLPQAIAGVLSVALLYMLVRRVFGVPAGLLAALTLAVTPVAVAVNRNNTIDALLILTLLAAIWAVSNAIDRASLGWLLLGAFFLGLGFNIKMMQAYLVLPALALAYILGSRGSWRTRFGHLVCAAVLLGVVSLAWAVIVDLTPASQRPYVGSSPSNSALNLALGYNGLFRLLPAGWLPAALTGPNFGRGSGGPGPDFMGGSDGPSAVRLFGTALAGQIAWLLPLALLGGVVAWVREATRLPLSRRQSELVIWGGWCVTGVVFFSVANSFTLMHRYYLAMLAPPIAALVGIGLTTMWADYRAAIEGADRWARVRTWLLPLATVSTALLAAWILRDYPDQGPMLTPIVLVLGLGAAVAMVVLRLQARGGWVTSHWLPAITTVGLVAILAAPSVWAGYTPFDGGGGALPSGGPPSPMGWGGPPPGFGAGQSQPTSAELAAAMQRFARGFGSVTADSKLLGFLHDHQQGEKYLLATASSMGASPIILATGEPVAALGGFSGGDAILTDDQLAAMVANGEVRFFLIGSHAENSQQHAMDAFASLWNTPAAGASGPDQGRFPGFASTNSTLWVNAHCTPVPETAWKSSDESGGPFGREQLFDCADQARTSREDRTM